MKLTIHLFENPDKFQIIVVHHDKNINEKYTLKVNNIEIESKGSIKLLGIEIDKLIFEKHIASLCKKAASQVHAICRLQNQMGKMLKEILINSFVYSNFNYWPVVWHFRCIIIQIW